MVLRVNVPTCTVRHFTERPGRGAPPRAPVKAVAAALGFASPEKLRAATESWWSDWGLNDSVSAAELVALVQLLQFKSPTARKLASDLASGGLSRVTDLPSEPLQASEEADAQQPASGSPMRPAAKRPQADQKVSGRREPPWAMCDPEDVGMDREALEKCRRYLQYRVKRNHFAGIVGGVVKNGKLVYYDEAGYADVENKVPMQQDTIMRLFSMTKCIVVVAFLTYAEDPALGINLDDPVWKYIPSFKQAKLAPQRGSDKPRELEKKAFDVKKASGKVVKEKSPAVPTLRQLLSHTAGLGYGPTLGDTVPPRNTDHYRIYYDLIERVNKQQVTSLEDFVNELAKIPIKNSPGRHWEYSFASDVLGRVLEVISGKPLDQVVEERVCGPLGMSDTSFRVPPEKAHRVGAWYERKSPVDDKGQAVERKPGTAYSLGRIDGAGAESGWCGDNVAKVLSAGGTIEVPLSIRGGMVSTFRDYLRFLLMIRNMGTLDGVRILKRETVQIMTTNQIPASTGRRAAWVFDKKGQGFNMIGQIQVQHSEKDTFVEKGELKKGGTTYACLMPGTVSAEFGWGGLGGPAWTIDPRLDLIVLSMTQTALELDHEENLRFSARRSVHAGIFGATAGKMGVTDYPPENHEGIKGQQVFRHVDAKDGKDNDAELNTFLEAELSAMARGKTLKELAIAKGNEGHEVHEDEEGEAAGELARHASLASAQSPSDADPSAGSPSAAKAAVEAAKAPGAASPVEAAPKPKRKRPSTGGVNTTTPARDGGGPSPASGQKQEGDGMLYLRVGVPDGPDTVKKARITAVNGDKIEAVTEGSWESLQLSSGGVGTDFHFIDETQFTRAAAATVVPGGPTDFGFLMGDKNQPVPSSKS